MHFLGHFTGLGLVHYDDSDYQIDAYTKTLMRKSGQYGIRRLGAMLASVYLRIRAPKRSALPNHILCITKAAIEDPALQYTMYLGTFIGRVCHGDTTTRDLNLNSIFAFFCAETSRRMSCVCGRDVLRLWRSAFRLSCVCGVLVVCVRLECYR